MMEEEIVTFLPVPWDIRLFLMLCGGLLIALGAAWSVRAPAFGSPFGLDLAVLRKSESVWKIFHERTAVLCVWVGAGFLIPVPVLEATLAQVSILVAVLVGGIVFIRARL